MANDAASPQRLTTYFHVHLVSDSTGETLNGVMRAAAAQYDNVKAIDHSYYLVRSERQLQRVLDEIENLPGIVLFTISNERLRDQLVRRCREVECPCIAVLDPTVDLLGRYLGLTSSHRIAGQHQLDASYFGRIEAVNFALAHDDGQGLSTIHEADVILVGVSRTSKTPTCVYLANRGVKAGNVPLVPGVAPPDELKGIKGPMVIGLKISPERLTQIRRARLISLMEDPDAAYADEELVRDEIREATRLFERMGWPVIDVSRRSVEETAAAILNKLQGRGE